MCLYTGFYSILPGPVDPLKVLCPSYSEHQISHRFHVNTAAALDQKKSSFSLRFHWQLPEYGRFRHEEESDAGRQDESDVGRQDESDVGRHPREQSMSSKYFREAVSESYKFRIVEAGSFLQIQSHGRINPTGRQTSKWQLQIRSGQGEVSHAQKNQTIRQWTTEVVIRRLGTGT